jgi:hypothetical protein
MEGEDYEEVLDILAPSLENGTLLQFEPAQRLWEKLYRYCEPGKLVTVIPYDSLWRPVKQDATWIDDNPPEGFEWMLNTYDGDDFFLTAVESYSMSENYHDTIDYDFTYSLKAEDMETGDVIFTAEKLTTDSQDDEDVIDYGLWMILDGTQLWYKKTAWPYSGAVNLIDPETQRKIGLKLALPGEGAYFLQNTKDGVDIGGFTFDDEYFGIAPLIDAQVVQCQKRAYRLIYQYKGLRDE